MFRTQFVQKIETHMLHSITFSENHAVYEILYKNIVKPDRPQMMLWRMPIALWIPEATNTQ